MSSMSPSGESPSPESCFNSITFELRSPYGCSGNCRGRSRETNSATQQRSNWRRLEKPKIKKWEEKESVWVQCSKVQDYTHTHFDNTTLPDCACGLTHSFEGTLISLNNIKIQCHIFGMDVAGVALRTATLLCSTANQISPKTPTIIPYTAT